MFCGPATLPGDSPGLLKKWIMRELNSFSDRSQADRLSAYLATQSIPASVDEEDDQWVVWITNDDDRPAAEEILNVFRSDPDHSRYDKAASQAKKKARKAATKERRIRRRQIDMTKRWSGQWWYSRPATTILIAISAIVAVVCTDFNSGESGFLGFPMTCNRPNWWFQNALYIAGFDAKGVLPGFFPQGMLMTLSDGDVWRLVTPIFLHFGVLHLLFNMMWMWQLGAAVEFSRGTRRYLLLVLLIAVISNVVQFWWTGLPWFGGMSGVVFGLIGYAWMKGRTQPHEGLALRQETLIYAMLWMFLCIGGAIGPIANAAHVGGFVVGLFFGARPVIWKALLRRIGLR